jgi:hypothetical protein
MHYLITASIAVAAFIGGLEYESRRQRTNLEGCEFIATQVHENLTAAENKAKECDELLNNIGSLGEVVEEGQ